MPSRQTQTNTRDSEESGVLYAAIRSFIGVNTNNPRETIADNNFSNLVNAMPLGDGNLSSMPGHTSALATPTTSTYVNAVSYSRNNNAFILIFRADGGAEEVKIDPTGAVASKTVIASAGTFCGGTTASNGNDKLYTSACDYQDTSVLIIDPVKGYFTYSGTTLTNVSTTIVGNKIAVFSGRVWISNYNTATYTIMGVTGPTDTNSANGFATFSIYSTAAKGGIINMVASTSYLFMFTSTAVVVINNISFTNSINVFQVQVLTSGSGIAHQSYTIDYDGTILMVQGAQGIYVMAMSLPQFVGDDITDTWALVDKTYGVGVSCGRVTINGRRFPTWLVGYGGLPLILCWLDGKWFFADTNGLSIIQILESPPMKSSSYLWGISSNGLYRLFSGTGNLSVQIQGKLYDMGDPILNKDFVRVGVEGSWASGVSVTMTADSENGSNPATSSPFTTASGFQVLYSDVDNSGKYLGYTVSFTTNQPWYITGFFIEYNEGTPW